MTYVVDTSVFLRWFVEQVGWQHAQQVRDQFLAGEIELLTPEFTRVELAEVLRKKGLLAGVLDEAEYLDAVQVLDVLEVEIAVLDEAALIRSAALAGRHSLRMFDAIGAALALDCGVTLLTGDAKAAKALTGVVEVEVLKGI